MDSQAQDIATVAADAPNLGHLASEPVQTNGTHVPSQEHAPIAEDATRANIDAALANGSLGDTLIPTKEVTVSEDVTIPAAVLEPPVHVAPGIQPVSDFLPSETRNSHPTPPPEPEAIPQLSPVAKVEPAQLHPSAENSPVVPALPPVDEPAPAPPVATDALLSGVSQAEPAESMKQESRADLPEPVKQESQADLPEPAPTPSLVRPREEDVDDEEPAIKRTKVEEGSEKPPVVPPQDVTMTDAPVQPSVEPATPVSAIAEPAQYHSTPLTDLQKSFLLDKTKNLKKTKHAIPFLQPVDIAKLNIPNYPNIVKNPMDLSTLETKLKNDQYTSPQEYANDFTQIVINSKLFNGDAHPVTISACNMEATFKKYMSTMPGPDVTAIPKVVKRSSPAAPRPQPRREARQPAAPAPAPASAPATAASPLTTAPTFALQADGTPQIRRDSTTKRPHRTIKPPQNRELSYAKPRRKEHQLELKFCEYVLDQIRGPAYMTLNQVFLHPVDPVALNIPHYRQVIKKPMDLSTMAQKLKSGQYGTAKEFKSDFDLMIDNCLLFNGAGNPVYDLGVKFKQSFENLWRNKEKWERENKKSSERASSASESEEEDEEEEDEDDPAAAAQQTIAALTKQLAELQKTVAAAGWAKDAKKKSKDGKKSKKSSFSAAPKIKTKSSKPKKVKPLSYDEKQEISNAVGQMSDAQVNTLTTIITDNCEKYRNMGDDMELEIDDLPNDVQALLLKHVRSIFGNPTRGARAMSPDDLAAEDDDDFAPSARAGAGASGKRKKHKPMGKREQQESIADLKSRLAAFSNPTGGSESPTNAQGQAADDTSGDDESEESEEE